MNVLGERLAELRKLNNLTQKELAEKLKISVTMISNYENGHKRPSDAIKIELARLFNVSLDYLLGATREEYTLDRSDVLKLPQGFRDSDRPALSEYAEFLRDKHSKRF